jgi:flagellar hook-basal body complex protein FliE
MDITALSSLQTGSLDSVESLSSVSQKTDTQSDIFGSLLDSALSNLNDTNSYIADANTEQVKLAMGETENTHDLTIAMQKASTALQYTVAVRDKVLAAYKEIINMQI